MKNTGIALAWIAGILLFGWLLFFLTRSLQVNVFIQAVNKTLAQAEDARHVEKEILGKTSLGNWRRFVGATGEVEGNALLFSMFDNGILILCIAFVPATGENAGKVEILPLNNHARAVFPYIHQGEIDIYRRRIEKELLP
ncbi:MAG: hypothetical protein LBG43_03050 [Treponema sp.]|nr:hypothetical protein [Treponema sp.]